MGPSPKNNSFTAADIERYHAGQMSAGEMHALEKAALDDPFLADAIEGYVHTSTPVHDLEQIKKRLDAKREKRRIIPMVPGRNWLKVAALLVLFAGGGWLAYRMLSDQKREMAFEQPASKQVIEKQEADSASLQDSKAGKNDLKDMTTATDAVATTPERNLKHKTVTPPARRTAEPEMTATAPAAPYSFTDSLSLVPKNNDIRTMSRAVPKASIAGNVNREGSVTAGKDSMPAQDVALNEQRVQGNRNDTIRNLNIVLKEAQGPPPEVVVLGYGNKKTSGRALPHVIVDSLEPAGGVAILDEYITANIKVPEELKSKPEKGEVQLSFDVDKEGQPVNIRVVKSLCPSCDEEAVRLLKEGPKWKKKKNKKGKITIRF